MANFFPQFPSTQTSTKENLPYSLIKHKTMSQKLTFLHLNKHCYSTKFLFYI